MTIEQEQQEALAKMLEHMLPTTSEGVLFLLDRFGLRTVEGGAPYDAEDYVGDGLCDLLDSTWKIGWLPDETHWTAQNTQSGDVLTYCDGDVYARDDR